MLTLPLNHEIVPIEITFIKTVLDPVVREVNHKKMPYFGEEVTSFDGRVLTDLEDIDVGSKVVFHDNICRLKPVATIEAVRGRKAYASSGSIGYILEYGNDDRNCWACTDVVNVSKEIWASMVKGE